MPHITNNPIKVGMVSLGCAKNQVDAEIMLSKLAKEGFILTPEQSEADVVIINTCGFIEDAKRESIENILEIIELKKEGNLKGIVVSGCLSQRYKEQIKLEMPEIDVVMDLSGNSDIVKAVYSATAATSMEVFGEPEAMQMGGERILTTPAYYAYLKVADGCDNCCSYCVIPQIRGKFRSRPMEELICEAQSLAAKGVRELNVIAQDTTRYGEDLYGYLALPKLLEELCKIEGIEWIRLLYCYPDRITDSLLEIIKKESKIVKYMDIPLQHVNGKILKAMNRSGDKGSLVQLISKIRAKIPEVTLRTTVITGFPGETEKEFEELMTFIRDIKFDRLGAFAYSCEEDTKAALLPNQLDDAIKLHRQDIVMQEQVEIMEGLNKNKIGETLRVLVEGFDKYVNWHFGRSSSDAPDVDSKVFFTSEIKHNEGDFVEVMITGVVEFDLLGEAVK
jgi:ribosomal protein S12 methylthiotransferase